MLAIIKIKHQQIYKEVPKIISHQQILKHFS